MNTQETTLEDLALEAYRRLALRGVSLSIRSLQKEIRAMRGTGASFRDLTPIAGAARKRLLSDPRIDEAVRALRRLDPLQRKEALRRAGTRDIDPQEALERLAKARESGHDPRKHFNHKGAEK